MTHRFDRIGWAMTHPDLSASQKSTLVILADAANEDQGICWLGIKTIAERTSFSERTVQYAIGEMESRGCLRVGVRYDKRSRQTSNYYQLGAYPASPDIDWRGATDAPQGCKACTGEGAADAPSIVNQLEGTDQQKESRKTTSSSAAARGRTDDLDQSERDDTFRQIRPGTTPLPAEKTRRVTRPRKQPRAEHVHQPRSNKSDGLACYWSVRLEATGAMQTRIDEVEIGKHFQRWLDQGTPPDVLRKMVDAFFENPKLYDADVPWARFVRVANTLRRRVGYTAPKEYEENTEQRLPAWAIEALGESA